jgi:hypothetical protein
MRGCEISVVTALFRLSLWLIIWFLCRVDVGNIADVSEVCATSVFDTEVGGNVYLQNPHDVRTQQQNQHQFVLLSVLFL